jgi:predicted amidohydrolase
MQALAQEAGHLDSDQLLRTRRPAPLQQPGDDRAGRRHRRPLSQEPHPRWARLREKVLLSARNTGFKVWNGPNKATLGVGVCWDQWYPEVARAMMLMGAEILFYPTAIGTEPHDPELDTAGYGAER